MVTPSGRCMCAKENGKRYSARVYPASCFFLCAARIIREKYKEFEDDNSGIKLKACVMYHSKLYAIF